MRTGVDHLPQAQQDELARIVRILMEEFEAATARSTQPWRRNGKIYKIVLFGSYARTDWVDEPENGYQSDFDLLIVVSHRDLTEIADYWYVAEDRILRDPGDRSSGQHHRPFDRRGEPGAQARRVFLGRHRARRNRALRASAA